MPTTDQLTRIVFLENALRTLARRIDQLPLRAARHHLSTEIRLGKLDAALYAASSATVSIWAGQPGAETDTGVNVTARDWLMGACASGVSIDASERVVIARILGTWYIIAAGCCG